MEEGSLMKIINAIVVPGWFLTALYFGCGGLTSLELTQDKAKVESMVIDAKDTIAVIYEGREYQNISAANIKKANDAYEKRYVLASSIFPWLNLPYTFLGLLLTSFAFGALGGSISLLKNMAIDNISIENIKAFSRPFLGGGCGIIILSVSYILPLLIVTGDTQVRSLSIVFVCLFGGLFTENFFLWLSSTFSKIFKP